MNPLDIPFEGMRIRGNYSWLFPGILAFYSSFSFFLYFTPAVFPMLSIDRLSERQQIQRRTLLFICLMKIEQIENGELKILTKEFQSFSVEKETEKQTSRVLWNKTCWIVESFYWYIKRKENYKGNFKSYGFKKSILHEQSRDSGLKP